MKPQRSAKNEASKPLPSANTNKDKSAIRVETSYNTKPLPESPKKPFSKKAQNQKAHPEAHSYPFSRKTSLSVNILPKQRFPTSL